MTLPPFAIPQEKESDVNLIQAQDKTSQLYQSLEHNPTSISKVFENQNFPPNPMNWFKINRITKNYFWACSSIDLQTSRLPPVLLPR